MNLNKAQIIGRITQPLELKTMPNGNAVLNFSVATNYNYKNQQGEKIEQTEFHNITSYGKQAEVIAQYFIKGQEIYCEGRLQTRNWDDKESGKKMYRTEIILNQFEFGAKPLGASNTNSNSQPTAEKTPAEPAYPTEEIDPEEIPF